MAASTRIPAVFEFLKLFFDDSGDVLFVIDSNNLLYGCAMFGRRSSVPKITGFAENVVPQYSLQDFTMHFRIGKGVFDLILTELWDDLLTENVGGSEPVSPQKQLLLFLWYMSNEGESMREVAHQFGLSKSTVCSKFKKVCKAIIARLIGVIHWPSVEEQQRLSREFAAIYNIEGVVGLLDGTHIMLSGCVGGDTDWINRSRYPSMQLQIVVDHNMKIINAVTGWPGCVHDARVLRNSSLYREAEARQAIQGDKFIIADSAYPLRRWLITPFVNNGRLTRQQRQFNRRISSCRQTVERAIGHLKGRFRRLKELPFHSEDEVGEIITAGCILHNICILQEDDIEHYIELGQHHRPNRYENVFPNAQDGVARRMMLMNLLNV